VASSSSRRNSSARSEKTTREAESGIGRILLDDAKLDARIATREQVGEIRAGRAGSDDQHFHRRISS